MSHAKPNELKRALGNPGGRKLPNPANVVALPQIQETAPAHLSSKAKREWEQIRAMAPWIANTDGRLLTELCEKLDRKRELQKALEGGNYVLYTDKGYAYANPAFSMLSSTEGEIFKILCQLGLSPVDRSKLGVAEVKARSKIQELLAQKNQNG